MKPRLVFAGVLCLAGLMASASYAGVTINGTTIFFNDGTTQSTAGGVVAPADHGGTNNTVSGTDSFIGGGNSNLVASSYSTVAGGSNNTAERPMSTIGGGDRNQVTGSGKYGVISGGVGNLVDGHGGVIGGGIANTATGLGSFIGGGFSNTIDAHESVIGGGLGNVVVDAEISVIGGGDHNTASGAGSIVGGGARNTASGNWSTVGGGGSSVGGGNTASGTCSTASGGLFNTASGRFSTVPGGSYNTASGDYSFVAGYHANDGGYNNAFVWDDGTGSDATAANTFNVNASGGIFLNGGGVHAPSDRNTKEGFSFVSAREVLAKVVEIPVTSWRFKSEDDTIRHIGPVAQDFMAAFGYGVDDTHITSTDADGVALAAIQALHELHLEKDAKLAEQAEVNTALRWHNAQLEARLARLENAILRETEPAQTVTD